MHTRLHVYVNKGCEEIRDVTEWTIRLSPTHQLSAIKMYKEENYTNVKLTWKIIVFVPSYFSLPIKFVILYDHFSLLHRLYLDKRV